MKRGLIILALLAVAIPAFAGWQSRDSNYNQNIVAAGGGFTGPGDIVSGAYAWYSCSRGYNTADTANACNVCLPADVTCADLTLTAGFAVVPAGLVTCNITTVICTVKTAYDKSGNGRNVTQATEANRPTFRPAMASNGCPTTALPCMLFTAASSQKLVSGLLTLAQPATSSLVWNRVAGGADQEPFTFSGYIHLSQNANNFRISAGTNLDLAATNGSWHATQSVFNNTSGAIYTDGASATGTVGAGGASGQQIQVGSPSVSNFFNGSIAEAGWWPSAFNSTQAGNMNTNQHGANGYNF